jgi:O-antigen/teichoic acid export membrane protein
MYKIFGKSFSNEGFTKYSNNTVWLFIDRIVRLSIGLFVSVWVTRYLGPNDFGLLSFSQSFVGIFAVFASLGLDSILVNHLIDKKIDSSDLLFTAFTLKLIAGFISVILCFFSVAFFLKSEDSSLLISIISISTIFQAFNVVDSFFQSKTISKYVVFSNIISFIICSIFKLLFVYFDFPLIYFALISIVETCLLALGYLYFFYANKLQGKYNFKIKIAKTLLGESWPLILSGGVLMIQSRIDQVMLKEMTNNLEVGYYSTALRLIEVFGFVTVILSNSLSPAIYKAKLISKKLYENRLLNYYRLNFILFLATAIPLYFFSEFIVEVLFGREFMPAGVLLALMSIRLFFTNMGTARGAFIVTEKLFKFSLLAMIIGTLVNICANFILIPVNGAYGSIIATIVSFTVSIFIIDLFIVKGRENLFIMTKAILTFYKLTIKNI